MKLITFNWCTRRIMEMKNATNFENLFPFSLNPPVLPFPLLGTFVWESVRPLGS